MEIYQKKVHEDFQHKNFLKYCIFGNGESVKEA